MTKNKLLMDFTDEEIRKILEAKAENTHLSYNDFLHELERRRNQRNANRVFKLLSKEVL